MSLNTRKSQGGAVLLVSLVMLLVLTVLAVSSMRGVTLESRITANRAQDMKTQNVADAALREAEFRFTVLATWPTSLKLTRPTARPRTR